METLKNFKFEDLNLKKLKIDSIKIIVEGTSAPELIIKYLNGREVIILGSENQINKLNKLKELNDEN